ncbi:hypothetical protein, partial [Culturomica sp.]|uniref:hypothetical protein n=1 Tax=Culturomica sp. TaxID=1926652 RepID=UPI000E9600B8
MKTTLYLIAILLFCSAGKPIKTTFDKGKFPRIKIVEKDGEIKVKVNTPDSTYTQKEILSALSKYWNIVDKNPVSTVQFVKEGQNVLVNIQREANFTQKKTKYKVQFQEPQGTQKGWDKNLPFLYAQDNSFEICRYKDISLYGCVRIVEKDADFKVKLVGKSDNYDLYVTTSKYKYFGDTPYSCGRWKIVDKSYGFYNFSIQFVDKDPDLTVYCEESWEVRPYIHESQNTIRNNDSENTSTPPIRISDCKFNGIPLYGRVQAVNSFATFKV